MPVPLQSVVDCGGAVLNILVWSGKQYMDENKKWVKSTTTIQYSTRTTAIGGNAIR